MSNNNTHPLMQPRYKVIDGYPFSEFPIGTIIQYDIESCFVTFNGEPVAMKSFPCGLTSAYYFSCIVEIDKHPHIFRKMAWWEERSVENMPEYVRHTNGCVYRQQYKFEDKMYFNQYLNVYLIGWQAVDKYFNELTPASLQEYNNYENQ